MNCSLKFTKILCQNSAFSDKMQRQITWMRFTGTFLFLVTLTHSQQIDDLSSNCRYRASEPSITSVTCNYENTSSISRLLGLGRSYLEQESWKSLEVTGNSNITSFPADYFTGIKDIESLAFHGTRLQSIPNIFVNLQQVFTMDLSLNEILVVSTLQLQKLGIHHLNLSRNIIRFLKADDLLWIPSVEVLDLSNNNIAEIADSSFSSTRLIRKLILSSNLLTSISEHFFSGLESNLKELYLGMNQISFIHPLAFSKLLELKLLDLSGNPLNLRIDVSSIKLPQHIVHLDLQRTKLSTLEYCSLSHLHDIEFINLQGNDLHCTCEVVWVSQLLKRHFYPSLHSQKEQTEILCLHMNNETVNASSIEPECNKKTKPPCLSLTALSQLKLRLKDLHYMVEIRKGKIWMHWSHLNSSLIYAYRIEVIEDGKGEEYFYGPVTIHSSSNYFKIESFELKNTRLQVCLHVMANETYDLHVQCAFVEDKSLTSIVGILAGIIFLIPCVIGLFLVIYYDRKHKIQEESKRLLHSDSDSEDESRNVYKQEVRDENLDDVQKIKKRQIHDGIVLNSTQLPEAISQVSVKFINEDTAIVKQSDIPTVDECLSKSCTNTDSSATTPDSTSANIEFQTCGDPS